MKDELKDALLAAINEEMDSEWLAQRMAWKVDAAMEDIVEERVRAWLDDLFVTLTESDGVPVIELYWSDDMEKPPVLINLDEAVDFVVDGMEAPRSHFEFMAKKFEAYAAALRSARHAFDE